MSLVSEHVCRVHGRCEITPEMKDKMQTSMKSVCCEGDCYEAPPSVPSSKVYGRIKLNLNPRQEIDKSLLLKDVLNDLIKKYAVTWTSPSGKDWRRPPAGLTRILKFGGQDRVGDG